MSLFFKKGPKVALFRDENELHLMIRETHLNILNETIEGNFPSRRLVSFFSLEQEQIFLKSFRNSIINIIIKKMRFNYADKAMHKICLVKGFERIECIAWFRRSHRNIEVIADHSKLHILSLCLIIKISKWIFICLKTTLGVNHWLSLPRYNGL